MINQNIEIYLASKSPRRRKLLRQLGIKFKAFSVHTDETILSGESPQKSVMRISQEKMDAAKAKVKSGIIITADTTVYLGNQILGKPRDEKDAFRILRKLSGKTHQVYSAYSIYNYSNDKLITEYVKTDVTFRKLSDSEILEYIKTGSPMDKAGAYGIQDDFGAVFVEKINGCYYNVVGLPLAKFYHALLRIL